MLQPNRQPKGPRHLSAASLDTNASGIAESTISLGLSRFPSPPSSIPSTPQRSNFDPSSPSRSSFNTTSSTSVVPLRKTTKHDRPTPSSTAATCLTNAAPSINPSLSDAHAREQPHPSTSSHISPYDWHGSASSIDVDATEDRLLPTSFITSLLQENKDHRKANRTSYSSTALTDISEMTYPPLMNHSSSGNIISARYSSGKVPPPHRPQDSRSPPSSFPQHSNLSNISSRISGDSETLHSTQGYPSIVRTPSISRNPPGTFVVGTTPAIRRNVSPSNQTTSTHDSDTVRGMEKGYQTKLTTTSESGDELLVYKSSNPDYSPALPSTAGTQRHFLRDSSRPDPNTRSSMHSNKSAAPSFFSRISGISSIRRVFAWRKVKPLPPVPIIPNIPISVEDAHRKEEELTPLPDLVNRAGVLRDLLDRDQHPHRSFISQPGLPDRSAPYDDYEHPLKKVLFLGYSLPASPRALSSNGQPIISTNLVPRKNKRLCMVISFFIVAALAAIGAGVGATVGKNKQGNFNCPTNFTGTSCNLGIFYSSFL